MKIIPAPPWWLFPIVILFAFCAFALSAEDVLSIPTEPDSIVIQTASGQTSKENIKDVMANYPTLRAKAKTMIAAKLDTEDGVSAKARLAKLASLGVALPTAVVDKVATRIETLRAAKETALIKVVRTDPARAKSKMDELIAKGVPISAATQAAVSAAQPPVVAPTTPPAEPSDGL